jgi:hypothetical protein
MVSGTYRDDLTPDGLPVRHIEASNYERDDFIPDPGAPSPPGSAFLVRMRRTNELFTSSSGESSSGPPIPYLFGRATLLGPEAKARGITVRATAIADARRAMSVGLPSAAVSPPLPGVTPFSIERSFWDGLSSVLVLVGSDGELHEAVPQFDVLGSLTGYSPGQRIGQFIIAGSATSVGQPISGTPGETFSSEGYVPIFQALPTERVIGFGRGTMTEEVNLFGLRLVRITKLPSIVAPENASMAMTLPLEGLDPVELANLLAAYGSFSEPLLAPALVR